MKLNFVFLPENNTELIVLKKRMTSVAVDIVRQKIYNGKRCSPTNNQSFPYIRASATWFYPSSIWFNSGQRGFYQYKYTAQEKTGSELDIDNANFSQKLFFTDSHGREMDGLLK